MPILVIATHRKAPGIEPAGKRVVTTGVLTQTMNDQHHAPHRFAVRGQPVLDRQVLTIAGNKAGERGFGDHRSWPSGLQGHCAITCATAAVSFLA